MITLNEANLPIKVWAPEKDIRADEQTLRQAINLANHPLAQKWIGLMPDFHVGYGMPIGGVFATKGGVVPNAVGVDIGCGMIAIKTNLNASQLDEDKLQNLRSRIHSYVPVGFAHHDQAQEHEFFHQKTIDDPVINREWKSAQEQIGTLGGGNHFIEIQSDEEENVWVMVHSGSRNLGKQVADHYHARALQYMEENRIALPDSDLAYLPEESEEYTNYLDAMNFCLEFAEANRQLMWRRIKRALAEQGLPLQQKQFIETHHNFAAEEAHFGQELLIHRKGAVRAEGKVIIPGSMGTHSYICQGLEPKESFNTCAHGAGRTMSRSEANRRFDYETAVDVMKHVAFSIRRGDYDELPMAYKDIDWVMEQQQDLVEPKVKLTPLAVVKG